MSSDTPPLSMIKLRHRLGKEPFWINPRTIVVVTTSEGDRKAGETTIVDVHVAAGGYWEHVGDPSAEEIVRRIDAAMAQPQ